MISYELSYGTGAGGVLLLGQLAVAARHRRRAGRAPGSGSSRSWFVFFQPVGFLIFMIAGIAETNRAPFDFPEAEQELVAGYHTEYSSMSFALFFLAEYINMVTVSAVATDLFLGGWHGPFLPGVARLAVVPREGQPCCCSSTSGCAGRCRGTATTS